MQESTENEDRVSDLHFQLSNADRRRIIEELLSKSLKLNEVAKKLDISATEAFRQLQRLTEAGFLEKIPDGRYRATTYARLILESSASLDFISKHREYFIDHDMTLVPPEFRTRLGELSKTALMPEPLPNLDSGSQVMKNAEKRIDVMAEQRLETHGQILTGRIKEGVKVRLLLQESILPVARQDFLSIKNLAEIRSTPRICAMIVLTDNAVGVAFPKNDGKMDYMVFAGRDPASLKWSHDLFEDQWKKARPWSP